MSDVSCQLNILLKALRLPVYFCRCSRFRVKSIIFILDTNLQLFALYRFKLQRSLKIPFNPTRTNPIQSRPVQSDPTGTNPIQSISRPVQSDLIRSDSVQSNSIQFNSIQFNSIQFNSVQFSSVQFNLIQFNPIQLLIPCSLLFLSQFIYYFRDEPRKRLH